jgi:hypothetical protein
VAGRAAGHAARALLAELVVLLALLLVAQSAVGLGDLLEVVLGLGVVRVLVGVPLDGQLPVRLLDRVHVRVLRDAQHLVEIIGIQAAPGE